MHPMSILDTAFPGKTFQPHGGKVPQWRILLQPNSGLNFWIQGKLGVIFFIIHNKIIKIIVVLSLIYVQISGDAEIHLFYKIINKKKKIMFFDCCEILPNWMKTISSLLHWTCQSDSFFLKKSTPHTIPSVCNRQRICINIIKSEG